MKTSANRLAARTEPDTNGGCTLWTGGTVGGYGRIKVDKKKVLTHRLAWKLANGPIPDGLHVLHRCDVPACVNPDHLFLGTPASNAADMLTKGRGADFRGERNGKAKLTDKDVVTIRARLAAGEGGAAIARDFSVSRVAVSRIKRGKAWTHHKEETT